MEVNQVNSVLHQATEWYDFLIFRSTDKIIITGEDRGTSMNLWHPRMLYKFTPISDLSVGTMRDDRNSFMFDLHNKEPRAMKFMQEYLAWKLIR